MGRGRDGKGWGREGGETGGWKPWSAPWPTFFAPVGLDSNPLEGRHNKRKRGASGPTDESAPPETTEHARGGSPSTSAREKLEPWGETRAGEARRASRRGEDPRGRSESPGVRRTSVQGPTRSRSSQNRAVTARDARRDRINALTASPDVRNGASALLRQLWESMLGARAEYGRVAEALRSPVTRNRGESARVDWTSPSPLPRLFRSPAEVRDRRDTTHDARVGVGRVHAESDGKIGTRENPRASRKLRARPFGVSADAIDWPQPPPFRPSPTAPPRGRPDDGGPAGAAVRLRDREDGSSLRVAPSPS